MLGQGRGASWALITSLLAPWLVSLVLCLPARAAPARAEARGPRSQKEARGDKGPRINAKSVLMVSFDGRKVLYEKGAAEVRSIASLSKLMAAIVVVERKLDPEGITVISPEDAKVALGGCRTRLLRGMKVRNRDLLHAALLASDNRAIPALGRAVGLSPAQLVEAMNARASKMGLSRTQFHDPVGIHHGNTSTAFEMAKILRAAVLHPVLQKVMRSQTYYFRPVWPKGRAIHYYNTNALVHRLQYPVYGGKTGFNNKAGYCFASAMRLPGVGPVLAVILGSSSKSQRFSDFFSMLRAVDRTGALVDSLGVARKGPATRGASSKEGSSKGASAKAASAKGVLVKAGSARAPISPKGARRSAAQRRPASRLASGPRGQSKRHPKGPRRPPSQARGQGSLHADSSD